MKSFPLKAFEKFLHRFQESVFSSAHGKIVLFINWFSGCGYIRCFGVQESGFRYCGRRCRDRSVHGAGQLNASGITCADY